MPLSSRIEHNMMMPEDRLKQAEALLETAARYITRHEEAIARQGEAIARHEAAIAHHEEALARQAETNAAVDRRMLELVDMFSELTAIARQQNERQERHEAEMRRTQAEIQRIWEYLLSQSGNGHSGN